MVHDVVVVVANVLLGHDHGVVAVVAWEMAQVLERSLLPVEDHRDAARLQAVEDSLASRAVAGRLQAENRFQTHLDDDLGVSLTPPVVASDAVASRGICTLLEDRIAN